MPFPLQSGTIPGYTEWVASSETGHMELTGRWATKEAVGNMAVIEGTAVEVDARHVGEEVPGMTARQ